MAIRRRTVSMQRTGGHRLRHPLLKHGTTTAMVYRFIEANPGCTYSQISTVTSSGQPVTDLINAGLLKRSGDTKAKYTYEVFPENATGPGRDQVEVELEIYVNTFGEYSLRARLVGQRMTAHEDFPRLIASKSVRISVPSPEEPYSVREVEEVEDLQIFATPDEPDYSNTKEPLILDGEYTIISEK